VGLLALVLTLKARRRAALPIGTLVGFVVTSLAAVSLSLFLVVWDLGP
jgi:CHASE2 domain-containing sensor protein